jgi:hypothetical protein
MVKTTVIAGKKYVLECECESKTYESGLGSVQRAVLRYLRGAPQGFGSWIWEASGECIQHGEPIGSTIAEIAAAIFGKPSAAQLRMAQRAARQLQSRGLADCWHGVIGELPRQVTNYNGGHHESARPVSGLYVAARWDCPHVRAHRADSASYKPAATLAELAANLAGLAGEAAPKETP